MKPFGPPSSSLRSRDYSDAIKGKQLDDKTIEKYIRLGYYGRDRQRELLEAEKKPTKKARKLGRKSTIENLLKELGINV